MRDYDSFFILYNLFLLLIGYIWYVISLFSKT